MSHPGIARWLAASLAACLLTGCHSMGYYGQAVGGQCEIVLKQRPLTKVLKAPETSPELAGKLRLVLELRDFAASQLGLPAGKHYLNYVDLKRDYVVWNVFAAPEFSLEPKSWWYPVVGGLTYRGYFNEADANRCADRLRRRGYDVYVGGIDAYSTLGWFHDPVLSSFADRDDADLATLIFHELSHQRVFRAGDTDFNESFATAVAQEGVRRWLTARSDDTALQAFLLDVTRERDFIALVQRSIHELETLYEEGESGPSISKPEAELRQRKQEVFTRLRARYAELRDGAWGGYKGYDRWFNEPLNNAKLNTIATYYDMVPAFHQLLANVDGDFEAFYGEVERLKDMDEPACRAQLEALKQGQSPTPSLVVAGR